MEYTMNELQDKLEYEVIPDILACKGELSKHNQSGKYEFEVDGKILEIDFKWRVKENESRRM